jgi:predicted nucleic acid-binding protein
MTAEPVRVVFDTNILVSAHFWNGPPYRCVLATEAGLVALVLSDPILAEFAEKLTVKFGVSKDEVDSIVERLRARTQLVQIEGKIRLGAAGS